MAEIPKRWLTNITWLTKPDTFKVTITALRCALKWSGHFLLQGNIEAAYPW